MTTREILKSLSREEGIAFYNSKKTDKEVYDILVSKGLTDSFETFNSEAKKYAEEKFSQMSKEEILSQIEGAELTDDQLEQIAGGAKSEEDETAIATTVLIGTGSALGGAVAAVGVTYAVAALSGAAV